jgi:HAD superfamily hydrolase (TIGR01509 family)
MARWIVFDAMGVIFEEADDILNGLVPFLQRRGFALDPETVHSIYRRASLGEISSREFWNRLGLGMQYPVLEQEYLDTCLRLDPLFLPAAESLSENYSLALLSNDIAEWSARLRRRHGLDRIFQTAVISSAAGIRKPDPGIYRILLDRLQAKPEDCVFIDDRIPNLVVAKSLGIIPLWMAKGDQPPAPGISNRIRSLSELPQWIENNFSIP